MEYTPGSGNESFVVIPIDRSFSDGDVSKWPTEEWFERPDDSYYRQKLAEMWLKETGVDYILDVLPEGYAVFDRPRGTNPDIRDRFLYGHPVGQYFYSTKQFFPHFFHLMTGPSSQKCPCVLCPKLEKRQKGLMTPECTYSFHYLTTAIGLDEAMGIRRGRPPGKPLGRPFGIPPEMLPGGTPARPRGKPPGRPPGTGRTPGRPPGRSRGRPGRPPGELLVRPVGRPPGPRPGKSGSTIADSEGTPDAFKLAVMKLKQHGTLSQAITEQASMDWRAERAAIKEYFVKLDLRPSYLPRQGELVLWIPDYEGELTWNSDNNCLQIYSSAKDQWLKTPQWRAGIISQIPVEENVLQDIVETTPKKWGVNYSGYRVETYPDPLSSDKSYSLHYSYVPLKCIKPFNAYELFLQGLPSESLHPSIEYALTVMSSFSLVDKHEFRGSWPNASVYCRGMFLGAELLAVGDAVRLKPKGYTSESANISGLDVMVIDEIRLELVECDGDLKSKQLAEKYHVRVAGKIYTPANQKVHLSSTHQTARVLSLDEVIGVFNTIGMTGYGEWYELHSGSIVDISQDMILGRCYEPDAMELLFGSLSLGFDLHGVVNAREYSRHVDARIPEGKHWFWGDFRTQTLDIDSLNGEDVGHYSETRDLKMWRANLRVIDGIASQADIRDAKNPGEVGRPSLKPRSNFAEVGKTSKLVSAGLGGGVDTSNPVSSAEDEEEDEEDEEHGRKAGGESESEEEEQEESEESEPEEDFTTRMDELRGGTEETEGGDYVPEDEPKNKRPKYDQ